MTTEFDSARFVSPADAVFSPGIHFFPGERRCEEVFRSLVGRLSQAPWVETITTDPSLVETEMVAVGSRDGSEVPLMGIEYIPGGIEERLTITQPIRTIDGHRPLSREQSEALRARWNTLSQEQGLGDITLWILDGRDTSSVAITADVELHMDDTPNVALDLIEQVRAVTPQITLALTEIAGH